MFMSDYVRLIPSLNLKMYLFHRMQLKMYHFERYFKAEVIVHQQEKKKCL